MSSSMQNRDTSKSSHIAIRGLVSFPNWQSAVQIWNKSPSRNHNMCERFLKGIGNTKFVSIGEQLMQQQILSKDSLRKPSFGKPTSLPAPAGSFSTTCSSSCPWFHAMETICMGFLGTKVEGAQGTSWVGKFMEIVGNCTPTNTGLGRYPHVPCYPSQVSTMFLAVLFIKFCWSSLKFRISFLHKRCHPSTIQK